MHFYKMKVIPARCETKKRRRCGVRPLYAGRKTPSKAEMYVSQTNRMPPCCRKPKRCSNSREIQAKTKKLI